jgi:peptidoglycan/xylan/chitin deacetylase (PgdA/CDA1 family)
VYRISSRGVFTERARYGDNACMKEYAAAAAGIAAISGAAYSIAGQSSQVFGPSVHRGPGKRRSLALTFDDGPSEGSLPLIEYLAERDLRATFFECGANVRRHPQIARAIREAGHEIGNHTYSHPCLCPRLTWNLNLHSPAFIDREFSEAQGVIREETGATPTLLRAPYGLRWYGMRPMQKRLGLLGVMWTVIGRDWVLPAHRIAARVLRKASPGGIICLHDGRGIQPKPDISEMLTALKEIVPVLKDRGYGFETVSELLRA